MNLKTATRPADKKEIYKNEIASLENTAPSEISIDMIKLHPRLKELFHWNEMIVKNILDSLAAEGYKKEYPVVIWNEGKNSFLVDGHHRVAAVNKYNQTASVHLKKIPCVYKNFKSIEEAVLEMVAIQTTRRNITDVEMLAVLASPGNYETIIGSSKRGRRARGDISLTPTQHIEKLFACSERTAYRILKILKIVTFSDESQEKEINILPKSKYVTKEILTQAVDKEKQDISERFKAALESDDANINSLFKSFSSSKITARMSDILDEKLALSIWEMIDILDDLVASGDAAAADKKIDELIRVEKKLKQREMPVGQPKKTDDVSPHAASREIDRERERGGGGDEQNTREEPGDGGGGDDEKLPPDEETIELIGDTKENYKKHVEKRLDEFINTLGSTANSCKKLATENIKSKKWEGIDQEIVAARLSRVVEQLYEISEQVSEAAACIDDRRVLLER